MIPTPIYCSYNSRARLWAITFEYNGFIMYTMYDDVNFIHYEREWEAV